MDYTLIGLVLVAFLYLFNRIVTLEGRVIRMKNTVDQLTKQVELPEDPINQELRELIKEGEDVKAIKEARKVLGFSLVEGKEYVDSLKMERK
ncbi:ribosomal protein L7/L12 [Virgibacillus natechei]|uniref:Ribosomal protein L7/L12 n=1 Tax=Virgibacillus natechei TaxID=1216297 RepID=A0ABS4IEP3_9BACI|nr:hypothetical protein [Virgibacillus natechei]MBP1969436.1 ribosomal protein L7/L12 [Virgibacillus natechei]UZD11853.1 hypothetical protein OLD84_12985 [Virgibacillus natechei]